MVYRTPRTFTVQAPRDKGPSWNNGSFKYNVDFCRYRGIQSITRYFIYRREKLARDSDVTCSDLIETVYWPLSLYVYGVGDNRHGMISINVNTIICCPKDYGNMLVMIIQ